MSSGPDELASLHFQIVRSLLEEGVCPANATIANNLNWEMEHLEANLRKLADLHGLVLHPHICEPWIVHPFSLTPTLNWIQGEKHSWWAPCLWCALGVAALVGGETFIHTRIAAASEPIVLIVVDGELLDHTDLVVHFAIPPSRAWNNVHQHCALVLPFHSAAQIDAWCQRHNQPKGQPVPIQQVAALARIWYGQHARPDWRKWTVAEAQSIFAQAGLTGPFWDLQQRAGQF